MTNVPQDSNSVIGIIDSVFSIISKNFESSILNIGSDNAACYHSQDVICLLPLIASKHNVILESYHFSEPQMGKGIYDRKISVMKSQFNQYVNENHNVTNIEEMAAAIKSHTNTDDVIFITCNAKKKLDFKKCINFPGISKYHSILYEGETMKFFRYFDIGTGVVKKLNE